MEIPSGLTNTKRIQPLPKLQGLNGKPEKKKEKKIENMLFIP
ncbi:hypothetical protein ACFLRY_02605 [Bacteroidota bacterium]